MIVSMGSVVLPLLLDAAVPRSGARCPGLNDHRLPLLEVPDVLEGCGSLVGVLGPDLAAIFVPDPFIGLPPDTPVLQRLVGASAVFAALAAGGEGLSFLSGPGPPSSGGAPRGMPPFGWRREILLPG